MNKLEHLHIASLAIRKLYPDWSLFIQEFIEKIKPFWLGTHNKDQVSFIQLIGYSKGEKAKMILIDLMELLGWETEMVVLWEWRGFYESPTNSQVQDFQAAYPIFPKIILTNFLSNFFLEVGYEPGRCANFQRMEDFLKDRKFLNFSTDTDSSDGRGSLIISFLDSFGDDDFLRVRLILRYIMKNGVSDFEALRNNYVPEELNSIMDQGFILKDEFIFFSKNDPYYFKFAFDLVKAKRRMEQTIGDKSGIRVFVSFSALDYFLVFIFYKKIKYPNLYSHMMDFFHHVFNHLEMMMKKNVILPKAIEVEYRSGRKYVVIIT